MHLKRWLTGIVAVPVLIYIIGFGPRWLFHGVLFLASVFGLIEFFDISCRKCPVLVRYACILLTFCLFFFASRGEFFLLPAVIFFYAIIPLSFFMFTSGVSRPDAVELSAKAVLAPVYVSLPLCLMVIIDRFPRGNLWIFFLLTVIFSSDTGAFYFGKLFGKRKLYLSVSPGKTWEGAVGGLLFSLLAAFLFFLFLPIDSFDMRILGLAAAISISGQIGDLAESMLKRQYGVKDSGKILPGHGGLLDRIDGLLFAVPLLYVFLAWSI